MHSPINKSIPDFGSYGYQALSEWGHNFIGGRVTYQATEIATQYFSVKNFGMICTHEVSRHSATFLWSDFDERSLTEKYCSPG